jgi:hypothetical protein
MAGASADLLTAPSPAVEKLWMTRENLVGNLMTQIFL